MKPLILSAAAFELDASLKEQNSKFDYFEFGVGIFEASFHMSEARQLARNREVIFIGSAGVFGEFDAPQLHCIDVVHWLPMGQRLELAYGIAGTQDPLQLTPSPAAHNALPPATTICSSLISLEDKFFGKTKPPSQTLMENVELYAVCKYLLPECSSLSALLCSTNAIGKNAHNQWKQNHKKAAQLTSRFVLDHLLEG